MGLISKLSPSGITQELMVRAVRCVQAVAAPGRPCSFAVSCCEHDVIEMLVSCLKGDRRFDSPEIVWHATRALCAVARAGERLAVLKAGGLELLLDLCANRDDPCSSASFDMCEIRLSALETVSAMVQSGEAKQALCNDRPRGAKLVQMASEMLDEESNRLVRAGTSLVRELCFAQPALPAVANLLGEFGVLPKLFRIVLGCQPVVAAEAAGALWSALEGYRPMRAVAEWELSLIHI
eukprot:TRINITY_DN20911_c0_g3_i1.p1 TRINITY_DN20911_c0_g3~~TRINITY_DN20911_c0_g3_i1.p1  ORF type:complete len:237 (+),score=52.07 TRINITY_DN20911_c0_g3_i1:245-955(+)